MALLVTLTMTVGFAYADEVKLPTLPTDNLTGIDVKSFYPTNQTYIVQISVHYQVESPIEVVNSIIWYDIEGQTHTILVNEEFGFKHYPQEETVMVTDPSVNLDKIAKIIAEKRAELEASANNGFTKLRACLDEFKEEQPVRFEAWVRTASLSEFNIPDEWVSADHYDRAQLDAQKKWVICEALKKYQWLGAYEANKSIDEPMGFTLDESDSPDTVPVTEEMMQAEIEKAEALQCSELGKARGLCSGDFTGINRGGYVTTLPDYYGAYLDKKAEVSYKDVEIAKSLLTMCDEYMPQYSGQIGDERFPTWLNHCVEDK